MLIRCSAPNMEDIVIGSAHQRCRVFVVRCCVTAELVDFDRDSRTDGLVYIAALFLHFRPSFLEFLRLSKYFAVEQSGNTQSAQHSWTIMRDIFGGRPPSLAPSSIFASGQARSPSWRGLTRRHREKKHAWPCYSQQSTSKRNQRVNDRYREYGLFISV